MVAEFVTRRLSLRSGRAQATAHDQPTPAGKGWRRLAAPGEFGPWRLFKRLTTLGFPRRFPIVQFPNVPLIAAFVAGEIAGFVHGSEHSFVQSAAYLAMTIWAYEELVRGVNWFRRLLGLAYMIILVVRVAHGLQG
jgi:hypothetical protein